MTRIVALEQKKDQTEQKMQAIPQQDLRENKPRLHEQQVLAREANTSDAEAQLN